MMISKIRSYIQKLFKKVPGLELSYSKISTYRFCPWKYKLVYRDNWKVPPTPAISLGLSIHETLEDYHKEKRNSLEDLLEIYDRDWVNEGFQTPQQTLHYYEKGKKMLLDYYDFSLKRKSEIVAVEKEFRFSVGSHILRGIIDRIDRLPDGTYEIIDYKTHAEMWDEKRIHSDLQLTFYSLGVKNVFKWAPTSLSYFFLAHNRVVETERSKKQEQEAIAEFKSVAEKIVSSDFNPNTVRCVQCDFKQSCRYSTAKKGNSTL